MQKKLRKLCVIYNIALKRGKILDYLLGYLLILCKTVSNLGEGVLIKKYDEKHSSGGMFFTGILSLFALIFFAVSDRNGFNFPSKMIPYAIVYGLIYCISYLLTFVALSCGSFTMSMLIISYYLVLPIIYGIIWLKEDVSAFTYLGFGLLVVSLFLVRGNETGEKKKINVKWVVSIVITTVGNGLLAILQKVQQVEFDNSCNNEFMMTGLAVSAAVLLIGGVIKDRKNLKEIIRYGVPYAGSAGVANGVTNLLGIYVNNLLPLSIVSPACAGVKIIMSFFTSKLLFKEKFIKRQIAGVIIGTAALIFLNL